MDKTQGYFRELNDIVNKVTEMILADKELCKLIKYDTSDPMGGEDFNTSTLMYEKIFPLPKQPNAETLKCTILDIYFANAMNWKKNQGFKRECLIIDIICHLDVWSTDYGLRPYLISQKLDELFNNSYIKDVSISNITFDGWSIKVYNDYFYGYRIEYGLTNNSNISGSR